MNEYDDIAPTIILIEYQDWSEYILPDDNPEDFYLYTTNFIYDDYADSAPREINEFLRGEKNFGEIS